MKFEEKFTAKAMIDKTPVKTSNRLGNPASLALAALLTLGTATAMADEAYRQAVEDAAYADQTEVTQELLAITKDNPDLIWNDDHSKLLVVTWKAQGSYEQFIKPYDKTSDNPDYVVWVSTAPQVKNLCSELVRNNPEITKDEVDMRLRQYLGLAPDWQYDVFVEMWVDPAEMFRPCVDPQIDDSACDYQFGDNVPTVQNIADYQDFYSDLYFKSFRGSAGVPWTGLGYTFDWGNPDSEIGASEFILVPGAAYEIERAVPTLAYCQG